MNVVFFGGSFDPPHLGHYGICLWLQKHSHSQKILISPSSNPQKDNVVTPLNHRKKMAELFVNSLSRISNVFELYLKELSSPTKTYTIDTLLEISQPKVNLKLAIGLDQYLSFSSWKNYKDILKICDLYVFGRKDILYDQGCLYQDKTTKFISFEVNASSSKIKKIIKLDQDIKSLERLLPSFILKYVLENRIYR